MKPLIRSRTTRLAAVAASAVMATTSLFSASPSATEASPHASAPVTPMLAQLPAALAPRAGVPRTLTVVLPAPVSGAALRAAIVSIGAVQSAAGAPGLAVRVLINPSPTQLASAPGAVIAIDDHARTPALALGTLASGHVRLTIAGTGEGLLTAARLLSSPAIRAFTSSSAVVPAGIAPRVTRAPVSDSVPVAPAATTGRGSLSLSSAFTLPVDRQLVGTNSLELVTGYDSAGGGRVTASLQGGLLGGFDVPGHGDLRTVSQFKLADDPALSGDSVPGWWAHPGANQLTLSATPRRHGASGTLQLLGGSQLLLHTRPRPAALQLGLWPFPIYDASAWSHATIVLDPHPDPATLAALIAALSNTERITGVPADPNVELGAPTASEDSGNTIFVGSAALSAASGRMPGVGVLHPTQPRLNGVLEELRLPGGGIGLLAYGARSLEALATGYEVGSVSGRAVLVDALGRAHTLAAGETVRMFAQPRWPWLAPAACLALLAFGWIAVRAFRARRRLASLPPFDVAGGSAS